MAKVRLFVVVRGKKGARIESVPLEQLLKLSGYHKTRWSYEKINDSGGWLVLEAF